ncbi:MAG TPA: alpha/beta fold hydrolase, partial [Dehalococcoidia bacterium]|nr:alpha/beta fold hydrolase [Dehalococcoidia bacterium]
MPTVHANGIDIWYERLGPNPSAAPQGPSPEGIPLVLTHGFAGPSAQWRPEVLPLADKRPLVLYDVRGHHRTTVPPDPSDYSLPTFAADLAALLKAIGIERAHIGGVSMGGMITAQFAVD